MIATTFGLVADLSTTQGKAVLARALQEFANKDFHSGAKSATELKMRFILAAGRLDLVNDGIVMMLAKDEVNVIASLVAVNRRLAECGATSTRWLFAGGSNFQQRAMNMAHGQGSLAGQPGGCHG